MKLSFFIRVNPQGYAIFVLFRLHHTPIRPQARTAKAHPAACRIDCVRPCARLRTVITTKERPSTRTRYHMRQGMTKLRFLHHTHPPWPKMNRHKEALETLIHVYSDNASAEMYCTLAGDIVPPRIAQVIADDAGLQDWTSTLFSLPPSAKNSVGKAPLASAPSIGRLKTVNQDLKKQLLKILLEVYMTHKYVYPRHGHLNSYQFHSCSQST